VVAGAAHPGVGAGSVRPGVAGGGRPLVAPGARPGLASGGRPGAAGGGGFAPRRPVSIPAAARRVQAAGLRPWRMQARVAAGAQSRRSKLAASVGVGSGGRRIVRSSTKSKLPWTSAVTT
jgi:hypothetical protein